jgi:sigma-54 dependent transcriptional regulator, acetoin dehydrogenase operon transcriptional activator AcoR
MRAGEGQTLSLQPRRERADARVEPFLFLVVQAARPRAPAARFRLDALDEIQIGRGPRRGFEQSGRKLRISVEDGWLSSHHAVIERDDERWRIVDQRSKNGTSINGARQREAALLDGDVIEVGQTFFLFRAELPAPAASQVCVDSSQLHASVGMATLRPELGARFDELRRVAASKTSIVIRGPSGTGKELLARAIHELSGRAGPFVAVNCAALPETLVESELFGYIKGAFSGADRDRDGLVVASHRGTLFLDEIGDLPGIAQAKLLRVLQEQEVRPVGATVPRRVDLRVVAATHRDLAGMAAAATFREDLLARLGGEFELPALRDRREDLGIVIAALLERIEDPRARDVGFTADAIRVLLDHAWPRNVRELEKALERAIALADGGDVEPAHLPDELRAPRARPSSPRAAIELAEHEQQRRAEIVQLLRDHGGNITAVARAMGKVRSQIQRWIKRYAIDVTALGDDP